ncbi:MAG: hypothetical protein J6B55_04865 [Clostridia bacterium]|nr:hypothetical protein [Clostridia bacterium]
MQKNNNYEKPTVKYVVFYSDEEITAELDINDYVNAASDEDDSMGGNAGVSGSYGEGDREPGVEID